MSGVWFSPLCWLCVCMAPAVTGSDRIRLEWNGSVTPPKPIHIPDGFEVWNYEGNRDVLPGKWEALTQAAFSDGPALADGLPTAADFIRKYVSQPQFDRNGFWFITERSKVVGGVFAWRAAPDSTEGILHWLAVVPSLQRQGLGTALIRTVQQYFMDRGISRVALHTQSGRDVAIALYIREGFVVCP